MGTLYLVDLISDRTKWLSARQVTIAGNIANADTAGFKAKDVVSFDEFVARTSGGLRVTDPRHIEMGHPEPARLDEREAVAGSKHSGNTVSVDQELMKAGEVAKGHAMAAGVLKSFQAMLVSVTRG